MTKHKPDTDTADDDLKAQEALDAAFLKAELAKQEAAEKAQAYPSGEVEVPQRFSTGGATYEERVAWLRANRPDLLTPGEVIEGEKVEGNWTGPAGSVTTDA